MMRYPRIEICAYNAASCFIAAKAGASRIEYCSNPMVGGTTPNLGELETLLLNIAVPIYPIIRPRGGNFVYSDEELDFIKKDVMLARAMGCPGISTGIALSDGRIDYDNMCRIKEWAGQMEMTCHKVFDEVPEPFEALETLIRAGVSRVLTSGLQKTAFQGIPLLKSLVAHSAGRISIMPGGGVRSANLASLLRGTGATEYHSSAIILDDGAFLADEGEVQAMVTILSESRFTAL